MNLKPGHIFDVVVIGAGAAGLMCAAEAGKRGRSVLVLEKAEKVGKKILISGGGRCNFTNLFAAPDRYVSENRHFCKSAFRQYTQHDFIALVEKHGISYHEKKLGQLFCDESASQITDLLQKECDAAGVRIWLNANVEKVTPVHEDGFNLTVGEQALECRSLVVATGGLSIPKMGATDFAFRLAEKLNLPLTERKPGLVPFTFQDAEMDRFSGLSGVSADIEARIGKVAFRENILFTHKGISGPAILQISSFWNEGDKVQLDFLPELDVLEELKKQRAENPKTKVEKYLSRFLANRLLDKLLEPLGEIPEFGNCSDKLFRNIHNLLKIIVIKPSGTEGYRKAEVTVGGVCTSCLQSKTMAVKGRDNLFFIGEAVDVTGFLGGYNFQWAWSSGFVAGRHV
ncbi:MAG: NAD(P)/FAD-dependent oxidoreductase [Sneathiellales bacterium]|nr:NAD(P)/FAD-dependent oxidoreductase [Sneathiellales bacterium]